MSKLRYEMRLTFRTEDGEGTNTYRARTREALEKKAAKWGDSYVSHTIVETVTPVTAPAPAAK